MTESVPGEGPPSLLVSVTEVRRHLGTRLAVQRKLEAHDLRLSDVRVPDGSDLVLDATVESISQGVVLSGSVTVPWVGQCRRCLEDVSGDTAVEIREIYENHPTDGETWPMVNDQIDVGPLIHDTSLLALPLAPLCSENCQGPSPDAYPAQPPDTEIADAEPSAADPRWAALDDLEF